MCVYSQPSLWPSLAMSLRFGDWKDTRMVFKTAYSDASGKKSEVSVSPAMVVASPEGWVEFDKRWASCLKEFKVSAFHASDFRRSDREFKDWETDLPKRRRFMNHRKRGFLAALSGTF